jgi:carboxyl-terminal processing protease
LTRSDGGGVLNSSETTSHNKTRLWRGFLIAFGVTLLLGCVFAAGYAAGRLPAARTAAAGGPAFDVLWNVQDLLSKEFLGDAPTAQAQAYGAAHGLVQSYHDPYTVFVEPAPRRLERDDLRGHFGGIGASMSRNAAGDVVIAPMRDRPAARAGVQDGDVLIAVDGKPITAQMTVDDVVLLVRGDEGSKVILTVRHGGQDKPIDVTVVRERIEIPSVEWRVLDAGHNLGYVRISIFGERTGEELQQGLAELAGKGVNKLVLDLRGNGGGLLDAAVDSVSQLVKQGVVLREVKRGGAEQVYPIKTVHSPAYDWPIVVLVDGGTASASEITAGALRDQQRGVLIGEKTFGKGSVQRVHELSDGSSLHVTVARWLTPNGTQLDKVGLTPAVQVPLTDDDRKAGRDPQLDRATAWLLGQH